MRLFMIFLVLVVSFAAGTAVYMLSSGSSDETSIVATPQDVQVAAVQEQTILVARQDIPVGKTLDANDIDRQIWPAHLVHEDFILDGGEGMVVDKVARTAFKQGQPLVNSFLANKDDPGFLAAQLPAGKRAVTIPVDAISGINGFIFPGDRVDVIVKHRIHLEEDFIDSTDIVLTPLAEQEYSEPQRVTTVQPLPREQSYKVPLLMSSSKQQNRPGMNVTEVLVANVRVLAVGSISTQYEGAAATPTNVTVEVTDVEAQLIRHAEEGTLSLALRSLSDAENHAYPRPVADADMTLLTPPSYFPFIYGRGSYSTEALDLEEVGYEYEEKENKGEEKRDTIAIIRGVEKEIVGAANP